MEPELIEPPPSELEETELSQNDPWVDEDDYIPIDSFYERSDSEDSVSDTFFTGYGDLKHPPSIETETYPGQRPLCVEEDFDAVEELKKLLPDAFREEDELHWYEKGWPARFGLQRTCFIGLLSVPILICIIVGVRVPLEFSVQLVLIRLAMHIHDRIWIFRGRKMQWHTLVSSITDNSNSENGKVQLERPLPMLGVETLYLIPMISAWYVWDGITLIYPSIATWRPVWLFLRFCLEEFLTVHWCDIIDEVFTNSSEYCKYLTQQLKNQDGKVCKSANTLAEV